VVIDVARDALPSLARQPGWALIPGTDARGRSTLVPVRAAPCSVRMTPPWLDGGRSLRVSCVPAPGAQDDPGATLQFGAASNRTYTVEFTDSLGSGSWQKLRDVAGQNSAHMEEIGDPSYTTNRFYRLAVPRKP
jgi:hypothetical protein